ncbi:MAG: sigma 54-interacting transcriptional regulator [Clostridiales bacterium]|nr:sigma 54-interacting transcriptional regulator [Clostridiales bacterium]
MKVDSAYGGYLREDHILDRVRVHTEQQLDENGVLAVGMDAGQLAQVLHLDRSNISKDLNHLNRQGKLIKFQGRPTLYLDRETIIQKFPNCFIPSVIAKNEKLSNYTQFVSPGTLKGNPESNAFDCVIGKTGSLANAIHMAKIAVQYPPCGLHTLLIGATADEKAQFAKDMHGYAVSQGTLEATAPFVEFNCQDYVFSNQNLISANCNCKLDTHGRVKASLSWA